MSQLGVLGTMLAQAAKDSTSSVAELIATQKQTIEQEKTPEKPEFQKIPGKANPRKRPHGKRPPKMTKPAPESAPTPEPSPSPSN